MRTRALALQEKAAAAKQASHAAALQAWHAGSSTWLGKRAGACGLAVYNRAERFVERVAAAVHAARQVMRDTRSAVIAARRKMQVGRAREAQAIEHVRTAYGRIEAAASDAKQRVVGLRLMGKAAQQQQPQQQQRAKQAQLQQEQAAKAAGRASDGGMLRSRLQQLAASVRGRRTGRGGGDPCTVFGVKGSWRVVLHTLMRFVGHERELECAFSKASYLLLSARPVFKHLLLAILSQGRRLLPAMQCSLSISACCLPLLTGAARYFNWTVCHRQYVAVRIQVYQHCPFAAH
eukprot:1143664-Pelagomonas_calceolata.AAC.1